jgi:ABC-2 type transport system ATP-binding protein
VKSPIIECRQLSHVYSGKPALADVNFELAAGEPIGLVSPNGASKSTLFNILSGFLLPTHVTVNLFGYLLLSPGLNRL